MHLAQCSFIVRMLYKDVRLHWRGYMPSWYLLYCLGLMEKFSLLLSFLLQLSIFIVCYAFCHGSLNEYEWMNAHCSLRHIQLHQTILLLCLTSRMELSPSRVQLSPSQATFKSHLSHIAFNDQPKLWCCIMSSMPWHLWNWHLVC